ncbi:von Willebrand factor A domain-containing protein 5A-like [Natator depressus]|uniref:von Willebrand factor A domain-containing protein 5A-like n=1 Tax=Natator depressus TaxID=27790 RepID=UPI003EB8773B
MLTLSCTWKLPLEHDGAARHVLLTVLHPRYTPHTETHRSPCASATCPTGGMGRTSPRRFQGELPYTLSLSAMLQSPHGIDHVLSNCPLTPLSYTARNLTTAQERAHPDSWVPAIPAGRRVLGGEHGPDSLGD